MRRVPRTKAQKRSMAGRGERERDRASIHAPQAAIAQASPASSLGIILSPEKLIHSPRLRIYCQMLARGGVRFPGTDACTAEEKISEEAAFGQNLSLPCSLPIYLSNQLSPSLPHL